MEHITAKQNAECCSGGMYNYGQGCRAEYRKVHRFLIVNSCVCAAHWIAPRLLLAIKEKPKFRHNADFAKKGKCFVKEGPLQLTLREMREMFGSARVWAGIVTVALIIGLIGPFQTFSYFSPGPRIAYWLTTVVVTYAGGVFAGSLVINTFEYHFRTTKAVLHIILGGLGAGTMVAILITGINGVALGDWKIPGFESIMAWVYCVAISMCISALHYIYQRPNSDVINPPKQVPLMARLNVKNRGQLYYLSMQDHYVNIVTSNGAELILLRLADAIKETDGVAGVKVHRSHWVALDAVSETRKKGSGMVAVMKDGAELPISRGQMDEARAAGLLPTAPA